MKDQILQILLLSMLFLSCKKSSHSTPEIVDSSSDSFFKITAHSDSGLGSFDRKIVVFDIEIYAAPGVAASKMLHAAHVMAQYLDNDEDGTVDDPLVHAAMKQNKAFLVMWAQESDLNIEPPEDRIGQDLGNDETQPNFVSNGKTGTFDAALEEVLHLINGAGHSFAYPEAFGQDQTSELAKAMDIARGGTFLDIPAAYPEDAWYTYEDESCDYESCQTIEYLYWALTSLLGAQENRSHEIGHEWKLHTPALVESTDTAIFQLLTNPQYKMPTILPDGSYQQ